MKKYGGMILRVWDIHPGYLSRESLLGQHVEIHAVFNVITEAKAGYAHHPETRRWRHNLYGLKQVHDLTVREMALRGYGHRSPLPEVKAEQQALFQWIDPPHLQFGLLQAKYAAKQRSGRIPLPQCGSQFWAHHKYAVMGRSYKYYREIQYLMGAKKDHPIELEGELVRRVLQLTRSPADPKALDNTIDHLWGFFKEKATETERATFLAQRNGDLASLLSFLYRLACTYGITYLLYSTVFSDC